MLTSVARQLSVRMNTLVLKDRVSQIFFWYFPHYITCWFFFLKKMYSLVVTSEMELGNKCRHCVCKPFGIFCMTMVLSELLIWLNICCTPRVLCVCAKADLMVTITHILQRFFFWNSLSGCPIAAAEKLAMTQDKSQLDSSQTGHCPEQTHRYEPSCSCWIPPSRASVSRVSFHERLLVMFSHQ